MGPSTDQGRRPLLQSSLGGGSLAGLSLRWRNGGFLGFKLVTHARANSETRKTSSW